MREERRGNGLVDIGANFDLIRTQIAGRRSRIGRDGSHNDEKLNRAVELLRTAWLEILHTDGQ